MIESKKIMIIAVIAMVFALVTVAAMLYISHEVLPKQAKETQPEYATELFGPEIVTIEILADEGDWQEMLDNAISEQFIMVDVVINGTKFENVGIRPKGNSSLTQVAQSESDRYSFRLQFDEYIKDQTCFGLDSLVVNNMLGDNTYMKEYISYDLMSLAGVDAPYFAYADISVNGEGWGLYLAVELYNDSYEQRVSGNTSGMLYNVKSMGMGGGNEGGNAENNGGAGVRQGMPWGDDATGQNPPMSQGNDGNGEAEAPPLPQEEGGSTAMMPFDDNSPGDAGENPDGGGALNGENETATFPRGDGAQGNLGGGIMGRGGNNGGSLAYIDDNSSSYSAIFPNVVGKGNESAYQRVIEALKALSEGRDLEKYFDVDQILRYLAAHTIVVNLDSYSSNMAQNYYIYEKDGQITILPWDYNMAWGGFQRSDAAAVVNFPIDTPVSGVEMSARPLLEKIFAKAQYLEKYHSYLQELIDSYFAEGKFATKVEELDALISSYVEKDATAFCTYDAYRQSLPVLTQLGNLRAESVQGQLDRTVPSTTAGQSADAAALISTTDLDLSLLGTMGGGFGQGGQNNQGGFWGGGNETTNPQSETPIGNSIAALDRETLSAAMEIIQKANGDVTDAVKDQLLALGLSDDEIEQLASGNNAFGDMAGNRTMARGQNEGESQSLLTGIFTNGNFIISLVGLLCLIALMLVMKKIKRNY